MDANTAAILAEQLTAHGLSVTNTDETTVSVSNPLNDGVVEAVGHRDGRYVTAWGYELGETGDEEGTAQRLAFLLGLPRR
ncbi:hypothetical protein ACIRLA_44055 [Streptomyces sp. NPDC102364]|uniref:hypothetical protein n=1 Tax=unclassified Streptomyces TaxID=2593676 RepID=UPI00382AED44